MPEKRCHLLIDYDVPNPPTSQDIKKQLETGSTEDKIDAIKTLILMILQDENFPPMIMTVVQFAMRVDSHDMKKLLMLYWEIIEKTNPDGRMKEEMVMLVNALRNDLLSPNEYVRARTLRLVGRLMYKEILDGLLQPVMECLEHRHPYVRRNAVMCVYSIFLNFGEDFFQDIIEKIDGMLTSETDLSTRRNALLFLFEADPQVALKYLNSILLDESEGTSSLFGSSSDILQLVVLDELKKVCKSNPLQKGRYMKAIFTLANSSKSKSVLFECANTIIQLTTVPKAIKLAILTFIKLLHDPSADNNIKLIVLEKLSELQSKFHRILQDSAVDIARVIVTPSDDIRKYTINLTLQLLSSRNVEDIVRLLKRELQNCQGWKETANYQELLVSALHKCAVTYPDITSSQGLVELLIDCCVNDDATAEEVIRFLQQLVYNYPVLREIVIQKLNLMFGEIQSAQVCRVALWILAEFSNDPAASINCILKAVGEGPFVNKKERKQQVETQGEGDIHRVIILPDGTYGTQIITRNELTIKQRNISGLRRLLTEQPEIDFYLLSVMAISLTKLISKIQEEDKKENLTKQVLLVLCPLVQVRTYPKKFKTADRGYCDTPYTIDPDNYERILQCIQALTGLTDLDWVRQSMNTFKQLNETAEQEDTSAATEVSTTSPDDLIIIKQLKGREGINDLDFSEDDAFKSSIFGQDAENNLGLGRARQLTGMGDPVYVECVVRVNAYDIILEFNIVNRTNETLQNLTLEISCQGDLKLVERPQPKNIGPKETKKAKASVKVSSTEAGVLFGNLTYDASRGGTLHVLTLNEIRIDAGEYIYPDVCTDSEFRKKWNEFNWESKVIVNQNGNDLYTYATNLPSLISMSCITSDTILKCSKNFLVANYYAKSRFNEDSLMNLSIEASDNKIQGSIKIRAKTKGMADCLKEKITQIQQSLGNL